MAKVDGRAPRGTQRRRPRRRWLAAVGLWSAFIALWLYVQVAEPPFMSCVGPSGPGRITCIAPTPSSTPPLAIIAIYLVGVGIILAVYRLTRPRDAGERHRS